VIAENDLSFKKNKTTEDEERKVLASHDPKNFNI